MSGTAVTTERQTVPTDAPDLHVLAAQGWVVIVWNDPVNLMSYVAFAFQEYFGYDSDRARELMLQVHHDGKAAVSSGTRAEAERDVFRLHEHGLWATMQQDRTCGR